MLRWLGGNEEGPNGQLLSEGKAEEPRGREEIMEGGDPILQTDREREGRRLQIQRQLRAKGGGAEVGTERQGEAPGRSWCKEGWGTSFCFPRALNVLGWRPSGSFPALGATELPLEGTACVLAPSALFLHTASAGEKKNGA